MLSILIPTYNYDIRELVGVLHSQATKLDIPFEIIVREDASVKFTMENAEISTFNNISYQKNSVNLGRSATRNLLAENAKYNKLLFLDADVLPKEKLFIKHYIDNSEIHDVVFGGVTYQENIPRKEELLRWCYGKSREAISVTKRIENPYMSIISAGLLIKKDVFISVNSFLENLYGIDIYFSYQLERMKAKVLHIDNPVIHLGLEDSSSFINKTKKGLITLYGLVQKQLIEDDRRPLQKSLKKLKRMYCLKLFQFAIKLFEPFILKNLYGTKPSMFLFDIFRLYYYSLISKNA